MIKKLFSRFLKIKKAQKDKSSFSEEEKETPLEKENEEQSFTVNKLEEEEKQEEKKEERKKEVNEKNEQKEEKNNEDFLNHDEWLNPVGELAIDLYETENNFIIESPIAGIKRNEIEISLENDVLKIKGKRQKPKYEKPEKPLKYLVQECFWGEFSRKIIFPKEIDSSRIEAKMIEGVLIIKIPKIKKEKKAKIEIK